MNSIPSKKEIGTTQNKLKTPKSAFFFWKEQVVSQEDICPSKKNWYTKKRGATSLYDFHLLENFGIGKHIAKKLGKKNF